MPLIVEDGSGVAGANSYVSVADAQAWVAARGLTFTGADSVVEQRLLTAMDLVESYRAQYQGSKTDSAQALQWPRTGVYVDGAALAEDAIPKELVGALVQLAYDSQSEDLQPNVGQQLTAREKIDVIEVQYFSPAEKKSSPTFTKALAFLQPLFKTGGAFGLRTQRV